MKYNFQNKRKSIGIKYGLKRFFQQFKFNFDLLRCYYKIKFKNPYKKYYDSGTKIPKILHFCWFGKGKYPELVEKCIATWKSLFPDFEFICWDEDNSPFDKYPFAKEALEKKKWAFVSDVARLHALYYEGGIYLDTDIEMLKSLDKFLENVFFSESVRLLKKYKIQFDAILIKDRLNAATYIKESFPNHKIYSCAEWDYLNSELYEKKPGQVKAVLKNQINNIPIRQEYPCDNVTCYNGLNPDLFNKSVSEKEKIELRTKLGIGAD